MPDTDQKFNASFADKATFKPGLRDFLEYRDLGVLEATNGEFKAHVLRVKKDFEGDQDMKTTGYHQHMVTFQMFYVLNGWVTFDYEGVGVKTYRKGDCVLAPAKIRHNELKCSEDFEALEILSPGVHDTVQDGGEVVSGKAA